MKRLRIILALILVAFAAYLYFSKPGELVVDEAGKIEGMNNNLRRLIQGKKFWRNQHTIAVGLYNESLIPHPPTSEELKELYQKMREDQNKLDKRMESLYSHDEQLANYLRTQADSLDRAAKWKLLDAADEKKRVMETEKAKNLVLVIESKLRIGKEESAVK
jgi:hypothetical protein